MFSVSHVPRRRRKHVQGVGTQFRELSSQRWELYSCALMGDPSMAITAAGGRTSHRGI
ncbi:hypothetical protein DPMN_122333 [Dreissena polymorpha]|uniref:Uncharacterized protein n=1 Tax=Dreissena polymorpha TaxID=45954 RepID=A0A9D4GRP7_DREPO|nr:hypothetical protein DPMN_122333 [Dreissena polymorpha]